ncbi:peptidylprolyl isomerase [Paucibacter sp. Y2R2-4]|uniref:peptidylprolyl isomerase n=1 Tax=Paucibacter sp. Y2R2-4 TaxID=2893553 RepID=UPI0021E516A3|nr:peptidylprolyl isomerase [Paucibacter sp. Y2R2-4]MCV2348735.1 peptidylprolyl isomerase [Paucibacter sp. Y2R2-4]
MAKKKSTPFNISVLRRLTFASLTAIATGATVLASAHAAKPKTGAEVLAQSPATDWRPLDPENTLLMELPQGQVLIELAPRFAPAHVANIRALARGGFYDGLAIVRVQDNFVAQWGDPLGDDAAKAKPLSAGANAKIPAEFSIPLKSIPKADFARLPDRDGWATLTGFVDGFPVAADPQKGRAWLAHCYATVGAGRSDAVDSSTGAELYAVIGQAPRGLDLNITTVGRVLKGIEHLASLSRGGANMGFYDKPEQHHGIQRVRLLAQIPEAERPALQVLRTESKTWPLWLETRRNRGGWFVYNPQHVDLCGVSAPIRTKP